MNWLDNKYGLHFTGVGKVHGRRDQCRARAGEVAAAEEADGGEPRNATHRGNKKIEAGLLQGQLQEEKAHPNVGTSFA